MNDSEDTSELRNPFPSPPSHYALYTSHNLKLLSLLKERDPENTNNNQSEILSDQNEVPDWPLTQLEKPRVDWILEEPDAYYEVFGDRWFVCQRSLFKSMRLTQTSGEGKHTIFSRTRRKSALPIKPHYRCSKADLPRKIKAPQ